MKKTLFVIGGPNGAGKSTFVNNFLPEYLKVLEFVNADYIAKGLSPFKADSMAITAGKIMLNRLSHLIDTGTSFGFETTMAGLAWRRVFNSAIEANYELVIYFLDIQSPEIAKIRVANRVISGGHNIPNNVIVRRYHKSRKNFFHTYRSVADKWFFFDNSYEEGRLIAEKDNANEEIIDESYWNDYLRDIQ